MRYFLNTLIALCTAAGAACARGQTYPQHPVTIICAFSPGGPADLVARVVSEEFQGALGEAFIVDYKPGGNATIGAHAVARAAPDGYMLLITTASHFINPATRKALPYDTLKDFDAVGTIGRSDIILIVNPSLPAHNVKELVAYAKKNAGKLNYASSGVGGSLHLGSELLSEQTGISMVHVPYKGGGPTVLAVAKGEVQLAFVAAPPAIPQINQGSVRVIGVASPERASYLQNVPTISEQGLAGFEVPSAYGIVTTAGTPPAIINRLNSTLRESLKKPAVRTTLDKIGVTPWSLTPQEFQNYLAAQVDIWKRVTNKIGFVRQ